MSRDLQTRERLIAAATRLFAERGFKHVTVRQICSAASANVAAVNYHFGDKMRLYREVIDSAAALARENTAAAIRAGEGQPPREQLRLYIEVLYDRISSGTGPRYLQQLMNREMNEPTAALTTLTDRLLKGRFEYLKKVLGAILDLPVTDTRVVLLATTIHAMVIMYRPTPFTERIGRALGFSFTQEETKAHLVRFAFAGLDGYGTGPVSIGTSSIGTSGRRDIGLSGIGSSEHRRTDQ